MNQKRRLKWEKVRAKGQSEFVLKQGGLIFGLLGMGLILPLVLFIFDYIDGGYSFSFFNKAFQAKFLFGLITSFPVGCLWGWLTWHLSEWIYSRNNLK